MPNDAAALFEAIERGDVNAVRSAIGASPALVHQRDASGATPMHLAAIHAQRAIVDVLLAAGADINARDAKHHATPAGWAIEHLRERGALLGVEIEDALYAIWRCDVDWLRRFVQRHPAIRDASDIQGKPLAEHAASSGNPEIARLFSGDA